MNIKEREWKRGSLWLECKFISQFSVATVLLKQKKNLSLNLGFSFRRQTESISIVSYKEQGE